MIHPSAMIVHASGKSIPVDLSALVDGPQQIEQKISDAEADDNRDQRRPVFREIHHRDPPAVAINQPFCSE
jgi:hypothetical protein